MQPTRWFITLSLLLIACAHRSGRDPVSRQLRKADAELAAARDPVALDAVIDSYLLIHSAAAGDPRVLDRLSRVIALRGYWRGGVSGASDLATARDFGLQCLKRQPAFAARTLAAGERITAPAARELGPGAQPCLEETASAWVRWMHLQGAGGSSLDLAPLDLLTARSVQLGQPGRPGAPEATRGLLLSLWPSVLPGGEPDRHLAGESALRDALQKAPGRRTISVDLVELVLLPDDRQAEAATLLEAVLMEPLDQDDPEWIEDSAAIARAQRLQDAIQSPDAAAP